MNILNFDTPKKVKSTKEHNDAYQSDSGIAGTYVPNMSREDMNAWKAKHIKGDDERIEIRKTISGTQLLVVVYKRARKTISQDWRDRSKDHNDVRISMNGKLDMTNDEYFDMHDGIKEAIEILL